MDSSKGKAMEESPKTVRASAKSERLNRARRQHSDRMQQFAEYLEGKKRGETAAEAIVIAGVERSMEPRKKLFSEIPSIEGERIVIDRVVDADADALRDLIDNPHAQRYLPTYLFEKQCDDVHEVIRMLYEDLFSNKESLILAIRIKETGELAGLAEFYGLRDSLHKVSVGCRLRERWWGNGIATEATRLMVDYLYGETDIEIITASTMVENKGSAHVLEKADFIRTARGVEEDWGFPEPTIVDKWFC
ncbi:MAG: GNAT family N-acetyltransferase [Eggerthellaceae bacterium]|nr:GNAT family N-acetyltransferase [Eggerthellaceae bacterium]